MKPDGERPPVIDYEGSDYQSTFWEQGGRDYEDQVEEVALRRLLPPSGSLLLEVGAGAGRNTPRYARFERVVLLDYSRSQLRLALERLGSSPRYIYVAADAYRLPFAPGQFDAATMIRTLHHMVEPQRALGQVAGALRTGGVFILEYANKRNMKSILRYALRRQAWNPFSMEPVEFAALNFDFHPQAVREWLQGSGFEVQRQLTVSHYRMGLLKRWVPTRLLVALDSLAQLSGDWWQLSPSVFVRSIKVRQDGISTINGRDAISNNTVRDGILPPDGLVFRCPECGHYPLTNGESELACPNCERRYAVEDGIYDLRGSY